MMDELFKTLRRFITRDLVYLIGGGSVVATFLYTFDRLPTPEDHLALYLLLAGISYVVAYVIQDVSGVLHVVPTEPPHTLSPRVRWIYNRYLRKEWTDIPSETDFVQAEERLTDDRQIAWLERITAFQQIGTTVGPCWFTSACLLILRWRLTGTGPFELALIASAMIAAVVLVYLA